MSARYRWPRRRRHARTRPHRARDQSRYDPNPHPQLAETPDLFAAVPGLARALRRLAHHLGDLTTVACGGHGGAPGRMHRKTSGASGCTVESHHGMISWNGPLSLSGEEPLRCSGPR